MSDEPPEQPTSVRWRETADAKHDEVETHLEELSNKELLKRVADLDEEQYPIASRARKALSQLEESSA